MTTPDVKEPAWERLERLQRENPRYPMIDEIVQREEDEEVARKKSLWGNVDKIVKELQRVRAHILGWLLSGATRAGKSTVLWYTAWLYSTLGFKIVAFDLPSIEGINVCEPGFFSLPIEKSLADGRVHPLLAKIKEIHKTTTTVPVKIYRPFVYNEGEPVGIGVRTIHDTVPNNVTVFTLALKSLRLNDWRTLLGELSPAALGLLQSALSKMNEESSVQDLIVEVISLSTKIGFAFRPDIQEIEDIVPSINVDIRAADKRSLQRIYNGLRFLLNAGLVMPNKIAGQPVKTNIDVESIFASKDWICFNFSPAIPTWITFGIMRYILRNLLYDPPGVDHRQVAICIPEIGHYAPRQIVEGREYYIDPMRDQLRTIATQHAKNGRIIIADTQYADKLDESLLYALRFQGVFASDRTTMEDAIRRSGKENASQLIASLPWALNENNHAWVFMPPGNKGYMIRADAIPPFRTHVTDEGDYDTVFERVHGKKDMVSVYPTCQYIFNIISQVQMRAYSAQKEQEDEARGVIRKITDTQRASLQIILKLAAERGNYTFLVKDLIDELERQVGKKEKSARRDLDRFTVIWGGGFIDRQNPNRTLVTFYPDKIKSFLDPNQSPTGEGLQSTLPQNSSQQLTPAESQEAWGTRKMRELRANATCSRCGSKEDIEFHHIEPTGLEGSGRGINQRASDILRHPEAYSPLCGNCHRLVHGLTTRLSADQLQQELGLTTLSLVGPQTVRDMGYIVEGINARNDVAHPSGTSTPALPVEQDWLSDTSVSLENLRSIGVSLEDLLERLNIAPDSREGLIVKALLTKPSTAKELSKLGFGWKTAEKTIKPLVDQGILFWILVKVGKTTARRYAIKLSTLEDHGITATSLEKSPTAPAPDNNEPSAFETFTAAETEAEIASDPKPSPETSD